MYVYIYIPLSVSLRYLPLSLSCLSLFSPSAVAFSIGVHYIYLQSEFPVAMFVLLACSLSLFLLASALLEEGFVEVSGGRWVHQ